MTCWPRSSRSNVRTSRHGLPDHLLASIPTFRETLASMTGIPPTVTPVADGDTIDLGEFVAEVVHTPGHTAGHCGFAFDEGQRAFIGDAVLPTYTPNIGAADVRVENPLTAYLDTLSRVAEAGYDRLFPGHHEPIDDPGKRVREIVEHHRDRTAAIYEILRERGSSTAWDVATEMFSSLKGTHVVLGASEAAIHLSYLAENGLVTCSDGRYRASNVPSSDVIDGLFLQS
jgi:glyoxylase-like metal-dependent hydrolase (beta-lactamase superfamily II)